MVRCRVFGWWFFIPPPTCKWPNGKNDLLLISLSLLEIDLQKIFRVVSPSAALFMAHWLVHHHRQPTTSDLNLSSSSALFFFNVAYIWKAKERYPRRPIKIGRISNVFSVERKKHTNSESIFKSPAEAAKWVNIYDDLIGGAWAREDIKLWIPQRPAETEVHFFCERKYLLNDDSLLFFLAYFCACLVKYEMIVFVKFILDYPHVRNLHEKRGNLQHNNFSNWFRDESRDFLTLLSLSHPPFDISNFFTWRLERLRPVMEWI